MKLRTITWSLMLALAACGSPSERDAKKPAAPPPLRLAAEDVVRVERAPIETGPAVSGTLEPRERAAMRAEVGGSVLVVGPEVGQSVERGTVLARIEAEALGDTARSARAGVQAASIDQDVARRELERTEALVKAGALAARQVDMARSQLEAAGARLGQAQAAQASARQQLGHTLVRSPITGVVSVRNVHVGDVVAPGAPLYEVIDPSSMRLEATVPAEALSSLRPGAPVRFHVRGLGQHPFEGAVERVAPAADPATRLVPIIVQLPNASGELVAGLFAEGRVVAGRRDALVIPLAAVDATGDNPSVLRVARGTVQRVQVTLGMRDEPRERVEVTAGLAKGDVLLGASARTVEPGTRVVLPEPGPAATATR